MKTKANLIDNLNRGDKEAFLGLYEDFYIALCIYARGFGVTREEAQDIVQDVFCKLYEKRKSHGDILSVKSYLYISVRNGCFNRIRDEKRRKKREDDFADFTFDNRIFFDSIVENEVSRQMSLLMNILPPQTANVFRRAIEGSTSEEIAMEMSLSVETVKTHRKKAKKILRENFPFLYSVFFIVL